MHRTEALFFRAEKAPGGDFQGPAEAWTPGTLRQVEGGIIPTVLQSRRQKEGNGVLRLDWDCPRYWGNGRRGTQWESVCPTAPAPAGSAPGPETSSDSRVGPVLPVSGLGPYSCVCAGCPFP